MTVDIKRLRKLATDATQEGPWSVKHSRSQAQDVYTVLDRDGMWVADVGPAPKDAAFIAAMSPEVVIALIDELEQLRGIANNAACWLEANTDKSARKFHAARIRHEIGNATKERDNG